ncbi:MAG: hypothetical protein HYV28_17665 [Ignavibacteriales bacterium]|nr:hypothetical protein [Ignavibacteriales bacterium]
MPLNQMFTSAGFVTPIKRYKMAKIIKPELILCTITSAFDGLPRTGLLPLSETEIFARVNEQHTWFGPRNYLELHTEFLQVVPYIVLRYGSQVAVYERTKKGTEARLHNLFSLGFGGHVQISDAVLHNDILDTRATIAAATRREMEEESIHAAILQKEDIGLILLDDEEVSRHHAGLLELWTVASPEIDTPDAAINNCRFMELHDAVVELERFESWSKAVISHLAKAYGR